MYSVTFVNPFDHWVHMVVRAGSEANCEANAVAFDASLGPGEKWSLSTDQNFVSYRRTVSPGDAASPLSDWTALSPDAIKSGATIHI